MVNNTKNEGASGIVLDAFSLYMRRFFPALTGEPVSIAVAVSGGPDSMVLCHLLSDYFLSNNIEGTIYALTVDHDLRPESAGEATFAGNILSKNNNVEHKVIQWVRDFEIKNKVQEEAREARYALIKKRMDELGIKHLFLAHHLDDQAETFLFRLSKGSGLDGLACMLPWQEQEDGFVLCRPLLEVKKNELLAYCAAHNIGYVDDPTNSDPHYARPRLRQSRKILEQEGLTAKRLGTTAMRMQRARTALDNIAENQYKNALILIENDRIVFNFNILIENEEEVFVRVVKKALEEVGEKKKYGPRTQRLEALCADLMQQKNFRKRTLGGVIFECKNGGRELHLSREHD